MAFKQDERVIATAEMLKNEQKTYENEHEKSIKQSKVLDDHVRQSQQLLEQYLARKSTEKHAVLSSSKSVM